MCSSQACVHASMLTARAVRQLTISLHMHAEADARRARACVQPSNVLVMGEGPEAGVVKVADFGLARVFQV